MFSENGHQYNPQIFPKPKQNIRPISRRAASDNYGKFKEKAHRLIPLDMSYPQSVLQVNTTNHGERGDHPTQKPVALYEYLIKTYTNAGDLVGDFCMGSGTTGVAAAKHRAAVRGVRIAARLLRDSAAPDSRSPAANEACNMTEINLTLDEAYDAIFAEFGLPPIDRDCGEFTINDYALDRDIPYNTAANHLARAVHAGLLTKREVFSGGKRCNAYKVSQKN